MIPFPLGQCKGSLGSGLGQRARAQAQSPGLAWGGQSPGVARVPCPVYVRSTDPGTEHEASTLCLHRVPWYQ